jgi:hypothetical protein
MNWKILGVAAAALSVSVTAADAGTRHRHARKPVVAPFARHAVPDRPVNVWGDRCTTDEGYGRRLPCDYGGK